jgi:tRNA(Ile)-lysidine synthase
MNDVRRQVIETVKQHRLISRGDHIVIGLSGGPDSVTLFDILLSLREEYDLSLYAVHVNHMIRPGDAENDQAYVEEICRDNGVPCRTVVFDCPSAAEGSDKTEEEVGRDARYRAFSEEAERIRDTGVDASRIKTAVAHNADDQVETILFRLLVRGTGTDGAAGMEYERADGAGAGRIIRPLLDCWKRDIVAYCEERGLHPCIDRTNGEPDYSRNRIRLKMIPYLEGFNPNVKEAVLRFGRTAAEDREFFARASAALYRGALKDGGAGCGFAVLDGGVLRAAERAVRLRAIRTAFKEAGLKEDFTFKHLENTDALLFSEKASASADLPGGFRAARVYGDLMIAGPGAEDRLAGAGMYEARCSRVTPDEFRAMDLKKGSYAAFDADRLEAETGMKPEEIFSWRTRKPGDRLTIAGGHRKKLQDIFTDDKVPRNLRDSVHFAAAGSEVLFIPPASEGKRARYSAAAPVTEDTKTVFLVELFRPV